MKNSFYEDYCDDATVIKRIQNNTAVLGHFKVISSNRRVAYTSCYDLCTDIIIDENDRNRAIHDDFVVVGLFDQSQWIESSIKLFPKDDSVTETTESTHSSDLDNYLSKLPPYLDTKSIRQSIDKLNNQIISTKRQPKGKVIQILSKSRKSTLIGNLMVPKSHITNATRINNNTDNQLSSDTNYIIFRPDDNKYPHMKVQWNDIPKEFIINPNIAANNIYVASIIPNWHKTSKLGSVDRVKSLGCIGDVVAETKAILEQYDIIHSDFTDEMIQSLHLNINNASNAIANCNNSKINTNTKDATGHNNTSKSTNKINNTSNNKNNKDYSNLSANNTIQAEEKEWCIPDDEINKRLDLRSLDVPIFTIDPPTAKDLDDAIHIQGPYEDGTFVIGVHIADVSYFVPQDSVLDTEARRRGTSVYLTQQVVPMVSSLYC